MSKKIAHRVAETHMKRQAGKAFRNHKEQMMRGYGELQQALSLTEGLLHYRLFGDGKTKGHFNNEPVLDAQQVKKAKALYKDLKAMGKSLKDIWGHIRRLEREFQWMDDNMGYM